MKQTSKICLAWDMRKQGVPQGRIAKHLDISRRTVIRWHKGIEEAASLEKYLDTYVKAKRGTRASRKLDPILKSRIYTLRDEHNDCCGQKIQYFLKKEYDIDLSVTTIYAVLNERYTLRTQGKKKNAKPGPVPEAHGPREVVQMDTVAFGGLFAFTAVDIFTREADVLLRPTLKARDGQIFLHTTMTRQYTHTDTIQTDGGSEFKAEFHKDTRTYCRYHRIARAYKKNEQSYIESFNRSLRKECLGWLTYRYAQIPELTEKVQQWLVYYHYTRPHIGLGMKPPLKR